MRKWTYLVAALLVGGATTTFTGCIDNDEPAGIEQLRGAKAEFIKAKAAYEDALTQIQLVKVEREKVKLEKDQVNLELKKCSLEVEQAKTAEQKAFWEAEAQKRTEEFKAKMLDLQTLTAQAEYNNKKALNIGLRWLVIHLSQSLPLMERQLLRRILVMAHWLIWPKRNQV